MTVKDLYPNIRPSFLTHLSKVHTLDPRITFTRATTATFTDATGTIQEVANNQARFDHDPDTYDSLGLRIEESRTNLVRNPRCEGATVSNPADMPFTMYTTGDEGISVSTEALGVEDGLSYVDVRMVGTTTATFRTIGFDFGIAGYETNQTYTGSVYMRRVAGTVTNINAGRLYIRYNLSPSGTEDITSQNYVLGGLTYDSLAKARLTVTGTTTGTITGSGVYFWQFNWNVGVAIDVTVRFAGPQLERGTFASSLILPPVGTRATSTRNGDVVTLNLSTAGLSGSGTGSVIWQGTIPQAAPTGVEQNILQIDSNNDSNRYLVRNDAAGASVNLYRVTAGAGTGAANMGTFTAGTLFKWGISVDGAGNVTGSMNGASTVSQSGGPTSNLTVLRIGANAGGTRLSGYVDRIACYSETLTDSQLRQLTK